MTSATAPGRISGLAGLDVPTAPVESNASGVSWAAVAGGAFVSAALSLILLALGAGLGLTSVSPWANAGATAATMGTAGVLWLITMQIISAAMGGYLAGRLRTKWTNTHGDEVYFRDTAHGFLVWAVGLVLTASFLASSAIAMTGGSTREPADLNAYYVDSLFRSTQKTVFDEPERAEASRIFASSLRAKAMPETDRIYLSLMIASRTGIDQTAAEKRIDDVSNDARLALDTARKSTAHLLLWTFIALLCGAFFASFAATIGGRQRDNVQMLEERKMA